MAAGFPAELLTQVLELPADAALAFLRTIPLRDDDIVELLTAAAMERAESDPTDAATLLRVGDLAAQLGITPTLEANLRYTQARLALGEGAFDDAERLLVQARTLWVQAGSRVEAARTGLGLTQIFAVQGRFAEAEDVITATIAALDSEATGDLDVELVALDARENLASLYSYQERFGEMLAVNTGVRERLLGLAAAVNGSQPDVAADLQLRLAQIERDLALANTYLDQPAAAETLLASAVGRLAATDFTYDRGQTRTNLGHLYLRTGRFAQALEELDAAALDLLGGPDVEAAQARWPAADVLFLEQGAVYLSLNLLPEAEAALRRAVALFRRTGQRYELGQALYLTGLLTFRLDDVAAATAALDEAAAIYTDLDNRYWLHRVQLVQAAMRLRLGDSAGAMTLARSLAADAAAADAAAAGETGALTWDLPLRVELQLLLAQLALGQGDLSAAEQAVETGRTLLEMPTLESRTLSLPHLQVRLVHTAGLVARAQGNLERARRLFTAAIEVAETQRALLPIEEMRAAFLTDKADLYADLTLSLLDLPQPDAETVAEAFAIVERARSRALLERLLATLEGTEEAAPGEEPISPEVRSQIAETRQRLYWLYNQLLGGESGSRGINPALTQEIRAREATLQQLEWRRREWLAQAEPVHLPDLQASLAEDQLALAYFVAGDEVMAFLVSCAGVKVVRNLCTVTALEAAQSDLRFQLGRVEIGMDYQVRHRDRLLAGARSALLRLFNLVLAPLQSQLGEARLLVIPFGTLHVVPFHALWNGSEYVLAQHEVTYAASASVAVHRRRTAGARHDARYGSLGGLAIKDPAIPQAEAEVQTAARHFRQVRLYLDEAAGLEGLKQAAVSSDVLHIATHGVFRPDNPFFSSLKLADGWVDVRTIYRLPLRARLVVLSACESGVVQVQSSDEAIGLVRGFLGAGAESLVVSLWNVHDATAAKMMDGFYAHLTSADGGRSAAALRSVQQGLAAQDVHPYFWAPYAAVGD